MATDFFQRQTVARRNTTWLVVMFVLAVICILVSTFFAAFFAFGAAGLEGEDVSFGGPLLATGAALVLIVGGSLFRIAQVSHGGGTFVAEELGGRRIFPNTTDPAERRVLNVVEEMALASGVPVPPVFLLSNEEGINAFAAGFSPSDAVVGITRGCAEQLSRDELQGVIAHEFSHILNGDMRLNLRLIGVLYGILLLGLVGRAMLRYGGLGGRRSSRNNGGAYVMIIGLALMVLGFAGVFFGNLIKAAISRQREYLADSSAVQFTRNPGGIAGALKRIAAAVFGSRLVAPNAAEASHMYFAEGLASMFATHPPLPERIRRIEPHWDGSYPKPLVTDTRTMAAGERAASFVGARATLDEPDIYGRAVPTDVVEHAVDQVASPTEIHRQYLRELLAAMPPAVVDAAHEPYGARALIYATLLDRDAAVRAAQLRALEQSADPDVFELTLSLTRAVTQLDVRARLPLVDMTLPALRALSSPQYQQFMKCFMDLVRADKRLGLFEWTLHQILLRHLRPQFERVSHPRVAYYGLQQLGDECSVLLSALARSGQHDAQTSFSAGAAHLPDMTLRLLPPDQSGLVELNRALENLAQTAPKLRAQIVDACAATICADGKVKVSEGELLRAVCDMLDCPMPPLLPGQDVSPSLLPARLQSRA